MAIKSRSIAHKLFRIWYVSIPVLDTTVFLYTEVNVFCIWSETTPAFKVPYHGVSYLGSERAKFAS